MLLSRVRDSLSSQHPQQKHRRTWHTRKPWVPSSLPRPSDTFTRRSETGLFTNTGSQEYQWWQSPTWSYWETWCYWESRLVANQFGGWTRYTLPAGRDSFRWGVAAFIPVFAVQSFGEQKNCVPFCCNMTLTLGIGGVVFFFSLFFQSMQSSFTHLNLDFSNAPTLDLTLITLIRESPKLSWHILSPSLLNNDQDLHQSPVL